MIKVTKENQGDQTVVKISGSIEENVDFEELIGKPNGSLVVNCKGIPRINSVGVKAWIKFFQSLTARGVQLRFEECSTAIVEQINLISNFTCGGEVVSIYVPFSCEQCKTELVGLFQVADLLKMGMEIPPLSCSKCGGEAVFDDIPEEYFNFLEDLK